MLIGEAGLSTSGNSERRSQPLAILRAMRASAADSRSSSHAAHRRMRVMPRRAPMGRKYSATYAILGGMADRERWEIDFRCPQCGLRGHARISQDHPLIEADDGQTVDGLTVGFKIIAHKLSQNSEIHCSSCNVEAKRT
jgi:hypothetical protein